MVSSLSYRITENIVTLGASGQIETRRMKAMAWLEPRSVAEKLPSVISTLSALATNLAMMAGPCIL